MSSIPLLSLPFHITLQLPQPLLLSCLLLPSFDLVPISVSVSHLVFSLCPHLFLILSLFQESLFKFCWGEVAILRGPEKAKQNILLYFYPKESKRRLNAAESCNFRDIRSDCMHSEHTAAVHKMGRGHQHLMTAVVPQHQTRAAIYQVILLHFHQYSTLLLLPKYSLYSAEILP